MDSKCACPPLCMMNLGLTEIFGAESGGSCLLQMILSFGTTLASDHPMEGQEWGQGEEMQGPGLASRPSVGR